MHPLVTGHASAMRPTVCHDSTKIPNLPTVTFPCLSYLFLLLLLPQEIITVKTETHHREGWREGSVAVAVRKGFGPYCRRLQPQLGGRFRWFLEGWSSGWGLRKMVALEVRLGLHGDSFLGEEEQKKEI